MAKQHVVYPYNRILVSHPKESGSDTYYNMVSLKNLIPNEIIQTQENKYCMIPLT